MKLYKLGKGVYARYRSIVKGNENTDYETIRKKLTRNIALAVKVETDSRTVLYMYGNLHISVRGDKVTWIKNIKSKQDWFYKDEKRYYELNRILGIPEDNTYDTESVATMTRLESKFQSLQHKLTKHNALTL